MVDRLIGQADRSDHMAVAIETPHGSVVELRGCSRLAEEQEEERTRLANRVCRITAGEALAILQKPALTVVPGTMPAATAQFRTPAERARLPDRPEKEVVRRLDTLIDRSVQSEASEQTEPGRQGEQRDTAIMRPLREWEGSSSPPCSQRPTRPSGRETPTLCEPRRPASHR